LLPGPAPSHPPHRTPMPKRTDIKKILIIGSGPIVIGQACEFDYSGTQGCKALREEGYEVVLVNSNPATIMTDPEFGDRTYIEPLSVEIVTEIIRKERPQALLPTLGGQTALNLAADLSRKGVLREHNVELIGANYEAIHRAEDRQAFKDTMISIGVDVPDSGIAHTMAEAEAIAQRLGFPCIIRPAYTLGGTGGGTCYNIEEFRATAHRGLQASPVHELLIEQSLLGWKEFELEVMRDCSDNFVVICTIENFDPMGVHTGDSITVAPIQTLTDREYQAMRDDAKKIIRAIGVDTGGSNIQFAVDPRTGRRTAIEMNPRVSRSSALASKATGFPIAKIAAKLAVGFRRDELPNDITRKTPACFEPTIDYCVVKIPRFAFEKFRGAEPVLGTQMKSVGETMAIGRTFKEALQKGLRGLEIGRFGLGADGVKLDPGDRLETLLKRPNPERIFYIKEAILQGMSMQEICSLTGVDPWFLRQIEEIIEMEGGIKESAALRHCIVHGALEAKCKLPWREHETHADGVPPTADEKRDALELLWNAKQSGFSDRQIGWLTRTGEDAARHFRRSNNMRAAYKCVDTCGGEFAAETPYFYSTYEKHNESVPSAKKKIIILGGGPNRIGQGIEFDFCCVHAVFALRAEGFEAIMVNSNPETVSTDYDISDKLYFEPVTVEDVLNICDLERPDGVIVQFGGQTPLNLARALEREGVPIIGTSPDSIDLAEDRGRFGALLNGLGILQPKNGWGNSFEEVRAVAQEIGYPVMVRPSYVLGGRAMEIVYNEDTLREYMQRAVQVSPEHPVLVDDFLQDATEVDVDALCDGEQVVVAAIMEHIEMAGIHSGDSACIIPSRTLTEPVLETIRQNASAMGKALKVRGLMNIQFAVKDNQVYVLEVNPRASRTVPYVSKTISVPLAKLAAKIMAGRTLRELGFQREPEITHYAVKEVVLPYNRFPGCEITLGPEMRSTGEVMGIDPNYGLAFYKAEWAAGLRLPREGGVFVSIADPDKPAILPVAETLRDLGYRIIATRGTCRYLRARGVPAELCEKISIGRPHVLDFIINNEVQLIITTTSGPPSTSDEKSIRVEAIARDLPLITTVSAARAAAGALQAAKHGTFAIRALQDYHADLRALAASQIHP